MAKKSDYHVVSNKTRGGWDVEREGAKRAASHHETKSEAMNRARDLAIKARVERVEHYQKGRIVNSNSYGDDPNPPRDRKH